jgi:ribulose-phosphate 3-epimerase
MNREIIPALMPATYDSIQSAALSVRHEVPVMQLDIMDGKYVPKPTWPFSGKGNYELQEILGGERGLPLWEDLNYELDLMVRRPEEELEKWLGIGASRVIFHYASVHDWTPIVEIDSVIRNFLEIGVAITVHDDLQKVYELLDASTVDFVQCMGIARIGYQGEPFNPDILNVITQLRNRYPEVVISVDGGVNLNTIEALKEVGVSRFVAGSAVFGHGMADENIQELYATVSN